MGTRITPSMDPTCNASSSARAGKGRRIHLGRAIEGAIVLACVAISLSPTLAAAAPSLLPAENDYIVKWSQADGLQPASSWDIEITPNQNPGGRFVARAQVYPEPSCWAVNVPVGAPSIIRLRAVSGAQASPWSPPKSVPGPGNSYRVKWYQSPNAAVPLGWDLEITPASNPGGVYVVGAQVMPESTCWGLNVPVNVPSAVRIRSVAGTQISPWSSYTTVPEPSFGAAMLAAIGGLGVLGRRRLRVESGLRPRDTTAPAIRELTFDVLATARAQPAFVAMKALRVATQVLSNQRVGAVEVATFDDPDAAHVDGELADAADQMFAAHAGRDPLGFEVAADQVSFGSMICGVKLSHERGLGRRRAVARLARAAVPTASSMSASGSGVGTGVTRQTWRSRVKPSRAINTN